MDRPSRSLHKKQEQDDTRQGARREGFGVNILVFRKDRLAREVFQLKAAFLIL